MERRNAIIIIVVLVAAGITAGVIIQQQNRENTVIFWTGAQTSDVLDEMIADFNSNPDFDFTVDMQEGSFDTNSQYDGYVSRLQSEDDSFDVFAMDVIWPPSLIAEGWLAPLDDILPESERTEFLEAPILASTSGDSIYGVPWFHDSGLLYYRTDVLTTAFEDGLIPENRAPQNWTELRDWSVAITGDADITTEYGDMDGFVWQGNAYEGLMCDFMEILGGTGQTSWLTQTSSGYEATLDTQNVQDALAFQASLLSSGASPTAVLTYGEEESRAVWNDGDALFHRNWPYAYALSLESDNLMDGDNKLFNVAPMPPQTTGDPDARTSCLGGWQLGINAFSPTIENAKIFIDWITEEEQQLSYFAGNGNLPTRKAAYDVTKLQNAGAGEQTYIVDFLPSFEKALPRPTHPDYPRMSAELWEPINSAIAGDITVSSAVSTMQSEVTTILEEDAAVTGPESAPFNPLVAFAAIMSLGIMVRRRRDN